MPAYVGDNKTAAQFEGDDFYCRQLAVDRTGISPGEAMQQSQAGSAILGTLLGAALGAGLGAAVGGGRGAGIGAAAGGATGLAGGLGSGTAMGSASASAAQQRYDVEYNQCMYGRGHRVPGMPTMERPTQYAPPPPPPQSYQPQPPSAYPPPQAAPCRTMKRTPQGGWMEVCE